MKGLTSTSVFVVLLLLFFCSTIEAAEAFEKTEEVETPHDGLLAKLRRLKPGGKSKIETIKDYCKAVEKLDEKGQKISDKCSKDFTTLEKEYEAIEAEAEEALDMDVSPNTCFSMM